MARWKVCMGLLYDSLRVCLMSLRVNLCLCLWSYVFWRWRCVCMCVYLCHWESVYVFVCVFKGLGIRVSVFICHWESIYLFVCVFKGLGIRVSVFICVIESPSMYLFVSLRVWELGLVCLFVSLRVHLSICLCLLRVWGISVCGIRGVCVFEGLGGWSLVTIETIKGLSH